MSLLNKSFFKQLIINLIIMTANSLIFSYKNSILSLILFVCSILIITNVLNTDSKMSKLNTNLNIIVICCGISYLVSFGFNLFGFETIIKPIYYSYLLTLALIVILLIVLVITIIDVKNKRFDLLKRYDNLFSYDQKKTIFKLEDNKESNALKNIFQNKELKDLNRLNEKSLKLVDKNKLLKRDYFTFKDSLQEQVTKILNHELKDTFVSVDNKDKVEILETWINDI